MLGRVLFVLGGTFCCAHILCDDWTIRRDFKKIYDRQCTVEKVCNIVAPLSVDVSLGSVCLVRESTCPLLHNTACELAQKMGIAKPIILANSHTTLSRVISDVTGADYTINAFATGFPGFSLTCVGSRLLTNLNDRQMRAVLAHEFSHIKYWHVPQSIALSIGLGCLAYYAGEKHAVLFALAIPITFCGFSRMHEKQADLSAARTLGDGTALAQGLTRIDEIFARKHPIWSTINSIITYGGKWNPLYWFLSTHPPLDERVHYLKEFDKELQIERGCVSEESRFPQPLFHDFVRMKFLRGSSEF